MKLKRYNIERKYQETRERVSKIEVLGTLATAGALVSAFVADNSISLYLGAILVGAGTEIYSKFANKRNRNNYSFELNEFERCSVGEAQ